MARQPIRTLSSDRIPSIEAVAKEIVMDGFWMQRKWPDNLVETNLPIPMAKGTRKRVAKRLNLAVDTDFHSLYDKAIHQIQLTTVEG